MEDVCSYIEAVLERVASAQLFFIGGTMKSGTTWLQLLLDRHPQVSCGGEGHLFNLWLPTLTRALDEHNGVIAGKNESIFKELPGYPIFNATHKLALYTLSISLLLNQQAADKTVRAIGEKTPDNVRHLPRIQTMFPEMRFIQIVRDGRDAAVSGWFHNLRVSESWTRQSYPTMAHYVASYAKVWSGELRDGDKFARESPDRYLRLRYEDMTADPLPVLAEACRFLGVDDDAAILRDCVAAASFETLSGGRPRGEEKRDSFFRKGVPGDWRNHLDERTESLFRRTAGPWLERLGYL